MSKNKLKVAERKVNKLLVEYRMKLMNAQNEFTSTLLDFVIEYNKIWSEYGDNN